MQFEDLRPEHRPFFGALFFTSKGELDLSWFFVLCMGIAGVTGFLHEVFINKNASIAAWSFLGSAFASILIAAVPINKARILANSRVPGEVATGIAESTPTPFEPHEWTNDDDKDAGVV
jgi:hypothetical protein